MTENAFTRRKPKTPQREDTESVSGRDLFQTPNYATDLLVPFFKKLCEVWECAAGLKKIANRLSFYGFKVTASDLCYRNPINFLSQIPPFDFDCIVTNPPFSLKRKFYERCKTWECPFALLIPADYSGWIIDAVNKDGAEKIIPKRRVDYITPNTLRRIHEGETWDLYHAKEGLSLEEFKEKYPEVWSLLLRKRSDLLFDSIYDAPAELLRKYSSSYYHSMWLTWGFGIGKSETFVELTNEMKNNI